MTIHTICIVFFLLSLTNFPIGVFKFEKTFGRNLLLIILEIKHDEPYKWVSKKSTSLIFNNRKYSATSDVKIRLKFYKRYDKKCIIYFYTIRDNFFVYSVTVFHIIRKYLKYSQYFLFW